MEIISETNILSVALGDITTNFSQPSVHQKLMTEKYGTGLNVEILFTVLEMKNILNNRLHDMLGPQIHRRCKCFF